MKGISYLQTGSGKDLVFLHGYLSQKESFYPQIKYFSQFYRVTALDFPGFGQSEAIKKPYSVDDYCDFLEEFLSQKEINFPHVIAHSFGCRVAIKCLARRPSFDKTVLCGCAGIVPKRGIKYRVKVRAYRIAKKLAPRYAERHFGSKEYRTLSPVMRESYKKIVNEDLRESASKITRPVLFINGDKDGETPTERVKLLRERVEGSRMVELKDCGHFAHLDNPLAFHLAVEEFFNERNSHSFHFSR